MALYLIKNDNFTLTNGENKVLKILQKMYEEEVGEVYIYVQPTICGKRPDFVVIDGNRGVSILEVKDWEAGYIQDMNRREAILEDRSDKNPLMQLKDYYKIIDGLISTLENINMDDRVFGRVIFTKLSKNDIATRNFNNVLEQPPLKYITSEELNNIKIDNLFGNNMEKMEYGLITQLRVRLFPEIKIVKNEEKMGADNKGFSIKALDEAQEVFARKIPLGNYMVSGIPGSGKTVMLMARAIHLIKEYPDWNVLVLTYNQSLMKKLNAYLQGIAREIKDNEFHKNIKLENIEILTFHKLAMRFYKDQQPAEKDDKWWKEVLVEKALKNVVPTYDAILIDEYQDFYDEWIKFCIKCCKPYKTKNSKNEEVEVINLFLAGDRLQSIYNPKDISWKKLGVDMRGRSKLLKTSYRTTKDSISVALQLLQKDSVLREEVLKFYKEEDESEISINNINNGTVSFLEGNITAVSEKIESLIEKNGYNYDEILVLCKFQKQCLNIIENLSNKYRHVAIYVKNLTVDEMKDKIIFTTYQSAKGLEAKAVILVGTDTFISNADKEKERLSRKLLYVGMTRASEKLFIHANSFYKESFAKDIKEMLV